jgi:hypothetical protein
MSLSDFEFQLKKDLALLSDAPPSAFDVPIGETLEARLADPERNGRFDAEAPQNVFFLPEILSAVRSPRIRSTPRGRVGGRDASPDFEREKEERERERAKQGSDAIDLAAFVEAYDRREKKAKRARDQAPDYLLGVSPDKPATDLREQIERLAKNQKDDSTAGARIGLKKYFDRLAPDARVRDCDAKTLGTLVRELIKNKNLD